MGLLRDSAWRVLLLREADFRQVNRLERTLASMLQCYKNLAAPGLPAGALSNLSLTTFAVHVAPALRGIAARYVFIRALVRRKIDVAGCTTLPLSSLSAHKMVVNLEAREHAYFER